jgi:hypothetical protein
MENGGRLANKRSGVNRLALRRAAASFCYLAALLCWLGLGGAVCAQVDDYEITPELERKAVDQIQDGGMLNEQNFNSWIFGNTTTMTLKSDPPQLAVLLAELDRLCAISPDQKQKLELAARMDLRIFLDDVEAAREQFLKFKTQQEMLNDFYGNVIRPLAMRRSNGFLGRGSLFSKVITTTLTAQQLKEYEAAQTERRKFQYQASIDSALLSLGDATGLSAKQHETVSAYLLANTPPPLISGRQDRQYVYYQLSQLSAKQFQEILPPKEAEKFKRLVTPYAGMKQSLISIGMLAAP